MCLYARSLTPLEGRRIQSIIRRSKNRVMIRRAQVVLLSAQGMRSQEISRMTYLHTEYVRELIRRFNCDGLALFQERSRSGRPLIFNKELRAEIIEYALSPPGLLGRPFSRWSVAKLREYLIEERIIKRIGLETVRRILKEEHISLQRTKTWKESNDPKFESKKNA